MDLWAPNCMNEGTEPTEKAPERHHKVGVGVDHHPPPPGNKCPRLRKRTLGRRTAQCDDVKEKKPDPSIYLTASKKLGVLGKNCLVVEDSVIGLQAATKAGMSCLVTYTSSTANQDFKDAITVYPDLSNVRLEDLVLLLQSVVVAN